MAFSNDLLSICLILELPRISPSTLEVSFECYSALLIKSILRNEAATVLIHSS